MKNFSINLFRLVLLTLIVNSVLYLLYSSFNIPTKYWLGIILVVFLIGFRKLLGPGFSPTMSDGFPTVDSMRIDHKLSNHANVDGPDSIFGFMIMLAAFASLYFCLWVT